MGESADLLSVLLGPLGALSAALVAVRVLWSRCATLEAKLEQERAARLADANTVADRLLGTWGKVSAAVETLERITSLDLPSPSLPPEKPKP